MTKQLEPRKILVTGGGGYIGSTLVPKLLELGQFVSVIDNFLYDQPSLNAVCAHPNFEIVKGDVRLKDTMAPLLAKADVVIPLAALVGAPLCSADPINAKTTNNEAVRMMLNMMSDDQLILMPTTNSAYGSGDTNNFCTEDSPLNPVSTYAIDKVEVERRLMEHPNAISFRLATVFGMSPRMRIDLLVNDFTYRAIYDRAVILFESHFKRNYIHVRDVCAAFIHALQNEQQMTGEIYNVGLSDANLSKRELCEKIQKQIPDFVYTEAPLAKDPDQRNYIVSNEKIEATGFKPEHSLDFGIAELRKGYAMLRNTKYGNV